MAIEKYIRIHNYELISGCGRNIEWVCAARHTCAELSNFAMALHTAEYKIILLGEPGVGKTNYFFRLRDDVFVGSSVSTVSQGVEHMTFKATVDEEEVKVQ